MWVYPGMMAPGYIPASPSRWPITEHSSPCMSAHSSRSHMRVSSDTCSLRLRPVWILSATLPARSFSLRITAAWPSSSVVHQASCEPMKLIGLAQLAIQARRTGFQRVLCFRNQFFYIQQNTKVAAKTGAIFVGDAGKLPHTQSAFNQSLRQSLEPGFNCRLELSAALGILLKINAEGMLLCRADELDVHHVEPM